MSQVRGPTGHVTSAKPANLEEFYHREGRKRGLGLVLGGQAHVEKRMGIRSSGFSPTTWYWKNGRKSYWWEQSWRLWYEHYSVPIITHLVGRFTIKGVGVGGQLV